MPTCPFLPRLPPKPPAAARWRFRTLNADLFAQIDRGLAMLREFMQALGAVPRVLPSHLAELQGHDGAIKRHQTADAGRLRAEPVQLDATLITVQLLVVSPRFSRRVFSAGSVLPVARHSWERLNQAIDVVSSTRRRAVLPARP